MSDQTYQKGEKVIIDCLTEQLKELGIDVILPGDELFIIKLEYKDDVDHYRISENKNSKYGFIIPENFLNKK